MARSDEEWIQDILSAIADIRADTAGLDYSGFIGRPTTIRSVLYSITMMGEAAKRVGADFKSAHPDVPWRAIAGIRDRIVHEYFRVNTRRIWDVVTSDIDELAKALGNPLDGPPAAG
jgi:uncharacterized protein with HEPN domain